MESIQTEVISELNSEDLMAICFLYEELMPDMSQRPENIALAAAKLFQMPGHYLIGARVNGRLAGTALAVLGQNLSMEGHPFLVIEDVVVSKEYRGRGIGKKMMSLIDQLAAEKQCWGCMLLSSPYRKGAHQFYRELGYTDPVVGFRKMYMNKK